MGQPPRARPRSARAPAGSRGTRRLAVGGMTRIDIRRKLVLVRRDDREHLLLLGQASELVIESDIGAGDTTEP